MPTCEGPGVPIRKGAYPSNGPELSTGQSVRYQAEFCPTCEVTLDLHDTTDGEDDFDCLIAGRKADLLSMFGRFAR